MTRHKLTVQLPLSVIQSIDDFYRQVKSDPNADNEYLRGYGNGIILCRATLNGHEPDFIAAPEKTELAQLSFAVDTPNVRTGWLIERANSDPSAPVYFAGYNADPYWTRDNLQAVRFAREQDAQCMSFDVPVRIAQHMWS